jgi:hypothetical protein
MSDHPMLGIEDQCYCGVRQWVGKHFRIVLPGEESEVTPVWTVGTGSTNRSPPRNESEPKCTQITRTLSRTKPFKLRQPCDSPSIIARPEPVEDRPDLLAPDVVGGACRSSRPKHTQL